MSKDNRYYLEKMQKNVEFILEHMDGVSKTDLENDPVLLDSMMCASSRYRRMQET